MDKNIQTNIAMTQMLLSSLSVGVDPEHRCIYLFGPINEMTTYRFIAGFKWLDRYQGPIHVLICSPGGGAEEGIAIYECIRTANNPVVTEGMGLVASAAVPVLLAGTVRLINPETRVMIHNLSYEVEGSLNTPVIHALSKEASEMNKWYHSFIAERTGKSIKDVEKWCADEQSFVGDEAVKVGLAHKVCEARSLPANYEAGVAEVDAAFNKSLGLVSRVGPKPKARKGQKGKK